MCGNFSFKFGQMGDEDANDARVILGAAVLHQKIDRLFACQAAPILTILAQRVEAVNHRQDARGERNVFAFQPVGIPAAVPAFVMMANNRHNRIVKVYPAKNLRADDRMHLHLLEFRSGQFPGFVQDVIRHGDLADIMQQRARAERFDLSLVTAHQTRDACRINLHAQHMLVRDFVFGVNRNGECFDRFAVSFLEKLDPLMHVVAILPVAKIDRDQNRRANDDHYQPVVLQSEIGEAGYCAGRQGNRRRPGEIIFPGAEEIYFAAQRKQTREQSDIYQHMDRRRRQQGYRHRKERVVAGRAGCMKSVAQRHIQN